MPETINSGTEHDALTQVATLHNNVQTYARTFEFNEQQTFEWEAAMASVLAPITYDTTLIEQSLAPAEKVKKRLDLLRQKVDLTSKRTEIIAQVTQLENTEPTLEQKKAILEAVFEFTRLKNSFLVNAKSTNSSLQFVHLPVYAEQQGSEAEVKVPAPVTQESTIPASAESAVTLQDTEVDEQQRQAELQAVTDAPIIAKAFNFTPEMQEAWQGFTAVLQYEIPAAANATSLEKLTDPKERSAQLKFVTDTRNNVLKRKAKLLDVLPKYVELAQTNPESLTELSKSALIAELINYTSQYEYYIREHHRNKVSSGQFSMFANMLASEISEEYLEKFTPLPASRVGVSAFEAVKTKDWLNIDLIRTSMDLEARYAKMGVKNIPKLQTVLRGSNNFFREMLEGSTPDSSLTFLIYAYHVHTAEDKMHAAIQFANYMTMSGLSNAGLGAAKRALEATKLKWVTKLPGGPLVKITAAILLTLGLDKAVGFDEQIKKLELMTDSTTWEAGGHVVGMLSGSTLVDQFAEVGYLTGLNTVNPETEQESFLGQRVMMAQQRNSDGSFDDEYHFWNNHAHTIKDWDDQVTTAIEREEDPAVKALWRTQYIASGPEGNRGWVNRQALKYYTEWANLRAIEKDLNALTAELGINEYATEYDTEGNPVPVDENTPKKPRQKYGLHLALKSGSADDVYGEKGITRDSQYLKLKTEIDRLKRETPNDPRVASLEITMNHAIAQVKRLANLRATYIHLDIFNSNWTEERPVQSTHGTSMMMPAVVQEGMISQIALNAQRLTKLAPKLQTETLTTKMPEVNLTNIPKIVDHIIDYIERKESVAFTRQRKLDLQHMVRMMEQHVPDDKKYEVFSALQEAISSQSNENLKDPDDVANALALAFVQEMNDGSLQKHLLAPSTLDNADDSSRDKANSTIPNVYQFGLISPEVQKNFNLPDKSFGFTEPSAPEKPAYMTKRAEQIYKKSTEHYNKMKALYDTFGTHSKAPVIIMSNEFDGASINTMMNVRYDPESKTMMVDVETVTNVLHASFTKTETRTGSANFVQTVSIPYDEWSKKHPQFASQIDADVQQYALQATAAIEFKAMIAQETTYNIELNASQEINEQEKAKLEAKQKPGQWHPFPMLSTLESTTDNRPAYQYVTYVPEKDVFAYLQAAKSIQDDGRYGSIGSASPQAKQKRGNEYYPRVTIEQADGSWIMWHLWGDYNVPNSDGETTPLEFVRALTIPIPNNNEKTIRNVVRMYMSKALMDSDHETYIINDLLSLYNQLDDPSKQRMFLDHILTKFHQYTREWHGAPWNRRQNSTMGDGLYHSGYNTIKNDIHTWAKEALLKE